MPTKGTDDDSVRHPTTRIFVDVPETMEMLHFSRTEVFRLIRAGRLQSAKPGRRRLVLLESILALADEMIDGGAA